MDGVLEAKGFALEGEHWIGHGLSIWVCEDEDRLDRYIWNGKAIKSEQELETIIRNHGKAKNKANS